MAATATLARQKVSFDPRPPRVSAPRSFVAPAIGGEPAVRLSHLDPRPLWLEAAPVESPWRSGSFWLAYALCAPFAAALRLGRRVSAA